jgi:secreted trypsin-like serine protease
VGVADPRSGKSEMILDQSRGHGACHGDSGGPAFVRQGKKMVLAGVTNRSYPSQAPDDCAHRVVYTKVSAYRSWIQKGEAKLHSGQVGTSELKEKMKNPVRHRFAKAARPKRKAVRHRI